MKQSNLEDRTLTDLHTHILPAVDDGAADLEVAWSMLRAQKAAGVERVALTPHFYPAEESAEAFLDRRQQAYTALLSGWDGEMMPALQLGAEVRYVPQLAEMDLRPLTIGGGDYLLLELPDVMLPVHMPSVLERILGQGIIPVLAHVERCPYFREEPNRLLHLVQIGALTQVTAGALTYRWCLGFIRACLENGLVHIIASDIHNALNDRPVIRDVWPKLDETLCIHTEAFARAIWENECPPAFAIHPVKKGLLGYYG